MKFSSKRNGIATLWLTFFLLFTQGAAWADDDDIDRIFFFGDSLSDSGNFYVFAQAFLPPPAVSEPPYDLVPSRPYNFAGGFQFSNGKTWARKFAGKLETGKSGKASLLKPGKFGNYAYGGARAGSTNPMDPTSASAQLLQYLADSGGTADDEALYVIQFGGNDIRDALLYLMMTGDFAGAQAIVSDAVEIELGIIQNLHVLGARNFLVADVPNLALTPEVKMSGPQGIMFASILVGQYNTELQNGLIDLEATNDLSITRLSFFNILTEIWANPGDYGIKNRDEPCINPGFVGKNAICKKPNKYLFWDGIHPTKKVHRIVGKIAAELYDDEDDDD